MEPGQTSRISRAVAWKLHQWAVERAALVITVSETVATALLQCFDVAPGKIRVVPNAADHLTVRPRRVEEDAPILHVGHLERHKNIELLIRAIATDARLPPVCLAGAPKGGEDERLKKLANDLGVAQRVTFLGRVEETELPELYSRAACVALPSKMEGFGIVAVEAQRAGVPLCVSDVEALGEVTGSNVPRFDSEDPQDCARAIREALSVSATQLESDRKGAMRFNWERSAELLCDAWTEAASRQS
jgi:glycosyltransferase involved in cell wall biosynthesis